MTRSNEQRLRDAVEAAETGTLYTRPVVREIRRTVPDVCPNCNLDHAGSCDW